MTKKSKTMTAPTDPPLLIGVEAPKTFSDGLPLPKVLVFDLDYTLWPFWSDTHVSPPLKPAPSGDGTSRVVDRFGDDFAFYPAVPRILEEARARGIKVAAASRTHAPPVARDLLNLLRIPGSQQGARASSNGATEEKRAKDMFDYLQIYPGSKTTHLAKIGTQSSLPYSEMLFFDDERRNSNVERELSGVVFHLVPDGVNNEAFDRGVREWRKRTKDRGNGAVDGADGRGDRT